MKKEFRLRLQRDFDRVFRSGRSITHQELTLRYSPNNLNFPRVAIVVSQKVAKKAAKRNLLKRRLKEIVRKRLNLIGNWDLIFIARNRLTEKEFLQLEAIVERLLKESKIHR